MDSHLRGGPPVQRFRAVFEDALHQRVNTATGYQIDLGSFMISVPEVLYVAECGSVYPVQVLELVDDQREMASLRLLHDHLKQVTKTGHGTIDMQPDLFLQTVLELTAQQCLAVSRDKQISICHPLEGVREQGSLADTSSTHHHHERCVFMRFLFVVLQNADFCCPVVKFHVSCL